MSRQEQIFLKGEADRFYQRNKTAPHHQLMFAPRDPALRLIRALRLRPRRVLEIGCANGWRLEVLRRQGASCVGVDPSAQALRAGRLAYPHVRFWRGTADQLPLARDSRFDLVILNFVFHWISRSHLLRAVKEIDRVLVEGGHLLIADFLPDAPTRVEYHHLRQSNVYTFKLDYSAIFESTGMYQAKKRLLYHDETFQAAKKIPSNHRAVCTLLQKSEQNFYQSSRYRPVAR